MSAECSTCGADLVYGDYPEMFCGACRLRETVERQLDLVRRTIEDLNRAQARLKTLLGES